MGWFLSLEGGTTAQQDQVGRGDRHSSGRTPRDERKTWLDKRRRGLPAMPGSCPILPLKRIVRVEASIATPVRSGHLYGECLGKTAHKCH